MALENGKTDVVEVPELSSNEPVPDKLMDALFDKKPGTAKATPKAPVAKATLPVEQPIANEDGLAPEDVEETAEEKPEEEEKPADDEFEVNDDTVFEVLVDGNKQEVSLKELRDNYSLAQATSQRLQQATEARKEAQQQRQWLFDANKQTLEKLTQLDTFLKQNAEPQIDWEWLRINNPQQYLIARDQQRIAQENRAAIAREAEETAKRQELIASEGMQDYLNDQAQKLTAKLPEMADPNKSKVLMGKMQQAIQHYGFTLDEFKAVTDHRLLLALADAAKYRELLTKKGIAKPVSNSGAAIPNVSRSQGDVIRSRKERETVNRARQTGHPDDVAMTLIMGGGRKSR